MNILQLKNHSLKIPDIIYLLFLPFLLEKSFKYVLFNCVFPALPLLSHSHQEVHTDLDTQLLRKKRMAQAEKNTCQLFIQTDHLFFKYYKSREAVIAQVTHRK